LAQAFSLMGYAPQDALAPVDADSERIHKKMAVAQAMLGAKAFGDYAGTFPRSKRHSEKVLDEILDTSNAKGLVDTARFIRTAQGKISVVLNDAHKFTAAKYAYVGTKTNGAYLQILQGAGWAASKQRYLMGTANAGISQSEDIQTGGATGVFCRVGTAAAGISHSYDVQVIIHPRVFQRADWYFYHGDTYGNTSGTNAGAGGPKNCPGRYEVNKVHGGTNEILFQDGVDLRDIVGMYVNDMSEYKELLARLKKSGITEVNGKPVTDFVFYGSPQHTEVVEKFGFDKKEPF